MEAKQVAPRDRNELAAFSTLVDQHVSAVSQCLVDYKALCSTIPSVVETYSRLSEHEGDFSDAEHLSYEF
jgi:hypothetical protein